MAVEQMIMATGLNLLAQQAEPLPERFLQVSLKIAPMLNFIFALRLNLILPSIYSNIKRQSMLLFDTSCCLKCI